MPFGPYRDFADCVSKNGDKADPEAYCAALEDLLKESADGDALSSDDMRMQIVAVRDRVTLADEDGDGIDDVTGEPVDEIAEAVEDEIVREIAEEIVDDMPERREDFHALIILEEAWTGDGRYIETDALSWRDLPLPLMALDKTTQEHLEARLIGNFTRIERMGREVHGWGHFIESEDDDVLRLQSLVRRGDIRGISADLDDTEVELVYGGDLEGEPREDENGDMTVEFGEPLWRFTAARIMGATVVPFPAFAEAYIEPTSLTAAALSAIVMRSREVTGLFEVLGNDEPDDEMQSLDDIDFTPTDGMVEEAERGLAWREEFGRGGTEVGVARARDIANRRNLSPDTVRRMVSYFARHEVDKEGEGWSPGEDGFPSAGRIAWALWGGDPGRTWAESLDERMRSREEEGSMTASAFPIAPPLCPPSSWFADPKLTGPTPMTVTDDGWIYGHLATWDTCHVGIPDQCVTPPRSAAAYSHFATGEIVCSDGMRVPVGQITIDTNHAPLNANGARAAAHYDDTGLAIADVRCGEDEFGIWMAGALRSDAAPEKIRALMASDVSGDWRRLGGALELVGVLAVNVPGFPKLRQHEGLVASMVASMSPRSDDLDPQTAARIADRIAASIGRSRAQRVAEVVRRVKG